MILMPIQAQTPAKSEETKNQEELARLNENANQAKNERGQKLKPGYLEMLMLLSIGMVAVTSPIPKRTDRALSDCKANLAGPVGMLLLKLMGVAQIVGEAKAYFKYSKLTKEIAEIVKKEGNQVANGDGDQKEALKDFEKTYIDYRRTFYGQKAVLESKKGIYRAMQATLATALALETTLLAKCSASCMARNIKFRTQQGIIEKSVPIYLESLQVPWNILNASLLSFTPLGAAATLGAKNALNGPWNTFKTTINQQLANNKAQAQNISQRSKIKAVKGWTSFLRDFQKILTGLNLDATNVIESDINNLEMNLETSQMKFNDGAAKTFKGITAAQATAIEIAENAIRLAVAADVAGYVAACAVSSLGTGTAGCATAGFGHMMIFVNSWKRQHDTMRSTYGVFKAMDSLIDTPDEVLFGNLQKQVEVLEKQITKVLESASFDTTKVELDGQIENLKNKSKDEMSKTLASFIKIGTIPYSTEYEKILDKKHTCCGSNGLTEQEVSKRIPIPGGLGIIGSLRDLKPPKPKALKTEMKNEKLMDEVIKMAFHNFKVEEKLRLIKIKAPPKSEKQLAIEFNQYLEKSFTKLNQMLGIPTAHADSEFEKKLDNMAPSLGLAGIMIAFKFRKHVKNLYDFATKSPRNRIAFYNVLLGLTELLVKRADKKKEEIDKQIEVITKLIEKTKAMNKENNALVSETDPGNSSPYTNDGVAPMPTDGEIKPFECANVGGDSLTPSPCGDQKLNLKNSLGEMNELQMNYPEFASSLNTIGGVVSNIAGSNNGQYFSNASLNNMDSAYGAMRKKAQKSLSQIKQIDQMDEDKQDNIKKMMDETFAPFLSAGISGIPNLATDGVMTASLAPPSSLSENKEKTDEPTTTGAAAIPTFNDASDGLGAIDVSLTTEELPTEIPNDATQSTSSLDQFEVPENDIIKEKDKSIFEALSDRYLLSYPKILKKAEPTPAGM